MATRTAKPAKTTTTQPSKKETTVSKKLVKAPARQQVEEEQEESRNVIVKDLEFYWAKLNPARPVSPFGTSQWELQVRFPKKRVSEMEEYGIVKDSDEKNVMSLNLKKKAVKADGSPAAPVKVVGLTKDDEIDPRTIGNGSRGNVKLLLRPYEIKGPNGKVTKRGVQTILVGVQVTELLKYEPKGSDDFDFDEDEANAASARQAKAGKGKRQAQEDDDEIPF
jgi:hypothetical protein